MNTETCWSMSLSAPTAKKGLIQIDDPHISRAHSTNIIREFVSIPAFHSIILLPSRLTGFLPSNCSSAAASGAASSLISDMFC